MRFVKQEDGMYLDTESEDNSKIPESYLNRLISEHEASLPTLSKEKYEDRELSPFDKVTAFVSDLKSSKK